VKFKWAVLNVLAKWPDRRVTFSEIRREVGTILETGNQVERERFFELGDIHLLQAGLVSIDDVGLQITDAGLSLLRSLEISAARPETTSSFPTSIPFKLLDSQIETNDGIEIFDRMMRQHEEGAQTAAPNATMVHPVVESELRQRIDDQISAANEHTDRALPDRMDDVNAVKSSASSPQDVPSFLRRSFAAKAQDTDRKSTARSAAFFATTANTLRSLSRLWRGHVVHDSSNPKSQRIAASAGAAILTFLSLVAMLACAAAAISLVQIKSLKTDIATLHRELGPLKERFAKLEQADKAKLETSQNAAVEKAKPAAQTRPDQIGLSLSREEVQLIRDFIKPAPTTGAPAPAINVGDPVTGATIPLPSSLTDKIPKLLGARFAIHSGTIIIVKRDSRQADAVLTPF
jgi:hypothetical protein